MNAPVSDPLSGVNSKCHPELVAALLRDARLTLLYGEPGAERDAVLRRHLMPLLGRRSIDRPVSSSRRRAGRGAAPERRRRRNVGSQGAEVALRFDGWGADPLTALRARIDTALPIRAWPEGPPATLADYLNAVSRHHGVTLLLVFDAFERHLAEPATRDDIRRFDNEFIEWLEQGDAPAHVLLVTSDQTARSLRGHFGQVPQLGRDWLRLPTTHAAPAAAPRHPPWLDTDIAVRSCGDHDAVAAPPDSPQQPVVAAAVDVPLEPPAITEPAVALPRPVPAPRRRVARPALALLIVAAVGTFGAFQLGRDDAQGSAAVDAARTAEPMEALSAATTAATPRWQLSIGVPPDAGSADAMVDELARRVARPAGITLQPVASVQAAPLAVWRYDALVAARAAAGPPLQIVAPLFSERIQVLVRADSPWRHVHELKGLRLNVGPPDGARARTARTLYRQLVGQSLPPAKADESDQESALTKLASTRSIDAVLAVAQAPLLEQLPPPMRARLRELSLDPAHPRTAQVLSTYLRTGASAADAAGLAVMSFLVAPAAPSAADELAMRTLAAALCHVQPVLQSEGSPLLRGLYRGQQPPVGWPYLVSPSEEGGCPAFPPPVEVDRGASTPRPSNERT